MQSFQPDLKYAAKSLLKRPAFSLVVILTLAIGIGANTAIFSVINAVLFKPLPIADEGSVVVLQEFRRDKGNDFGVSYLDFADWRSQSQSFSSMAIVSTDEVTMKADGDPVRAVGAIVSADIFKTLGLQPELGRAFVAADDQPGTSEGLSPVMLTHSAWQNRFGGDRKIVGRSVVIDEKPYQVIGVTPANIFPLQKEPIEFWMTVAANGDPGRKGSANGSRGYRLYDGVVARLRPGVSLQQAQAELDVINESIKQNSPSLNKQLGVRAVQLRQLFTGDVRKMLWLLLGVVGAVLLIACVNVANILLARATTRQREIAIRTALGATRWDIARQLLTESFLLAALGGLVGVLLSMWLVAGIVSLLPAEVPRLTGLTPDIRVLLFTIGIALLTGLLCGLLPALTATKSNLSDAIKEGGRTGTGSMFHGRLRNTLVIGEVAVALTLLVGAGLLINSLLRLNQVRPGFSTENTLTVQLNLSGNRYFTDDMKPDRINSFLDTLTERVKRLPSVSEVSYAQCVPLTAIDNNTGFGIVERPSPPGENLIAQLRFIGTGYFRVLEIPIKSGRDFTARDNPQSPNVVLVNEEFVRTYLKEENPIGKHLKLGWGGDDPKEIVGVVGDVRHRSLSDQARPEMYVPQAQFANAGVSLIVRSQGDPESLIGAIRKEVRELDPEMPLAEIKTLAAYRNEALAIPRFNTFLLGVFALIALALTLVGLFGVMSYNVSQRTQEIGIRMALGAEATDVLRMVIKQGMILVVIGILIGIGAAAGLTRLMKGLLFDVSATDPATFAAIALLLAAVSLLACYIPARRATKVDPMIALRYE